MTWKECSRSRKIERMYLWKIKTCSLLLGVSHPWTIFRQLIRKFSFGYTYEECLRHGMRGRCHHGFMLQILCLFLWRHLENILLNKRAEIFWYWNETELSKYIWKLKTDNWAFNIQWSIVKRVAPYRAWSRRCNLCLEEKVLIMKAKNKHFLNRRREFFSKCRHVTKHRLNQRHVIRIVEPDLSVGLRSRKAWNSE